MTICTVPGCQEHYGCRLKSKGIRLSTKATPTKRMNMRPTPHAIPDSHRQLLVSERPDGSKMPILDANGDFINIKRYREQRSKIDPLLRRIRQGTTPTSKE